MSFWCMHSEVIGDDEGYAICTRCRAGFYNGPLRERDLIDAFDKMARDAGMRTPTELRLEEGME